MTWIDYKDLNITDGAFSRLFLDYIGDYQKVQKFYGGNFRDESAWRSVLEKVSNRAMDRGPIVQILSNQNRNFQCGIKTLANIDLLLNDNTVAVVTGQQVGLFTGPLYTIYKTLTAIKLAEQINAKYQDYHAVPVFWLEGEDHDYEEVTRINLINGSNDLVHIEYPLEAKREKKNVGAVGKIEFTDSINDLFGAIDQTLIQTEFKPKVLDLFKTAYQKGMTFNKAFVHLMNVLVEDSGLIFFDPNDPDAKKLVAPIFQREITDTPKIGQLVIDQSVELENIYHAQVKPRSINLFLFHGGGRYPIEPHPDGYSLKGTRQHITKEEMSGFLKNSPELFSPNVVLRPICQDWLLPTAAYVAGPSEVAYFAQFRPLYEEFNIPEPIIYPRASVTILEEKVEKVLTRFALQVTQFFEDVEFLKQKIAVQISDFKVDELFASTNGAIEESLNSLRSGMQTIDPTLMGALDNTLGKIKSQIDVLKEKTLAAQKRQHEVYLRQIDKAAIFLFPNSNFQERELNVLYFLNKYGLEFVRWLNNEIEIDKFKHQVVKL
ncbi:MAG: bacillithiol biosynthesis cysteine-adding enzyme BshC [Bacteroidota bacterium]